MYNTGGQVIAMTVLDKARADLGNDRRFEVTSNLTRVECEVYLDGEVNNKYKEIAKVNFVVPSSGAVEIQVQIPWIKNDSSSEGRLRMGLYDPVQAEYDFTTDGQEGVASFKNGPTASEASTNRPFSVHRSFVLTRLQPGALLTREIHLEKVGANTGGSDNVMVRWGHGAGSVGYGQLIIKVITVPAMIQEHFHHISVTDV